MNLHFDGSFGLNVLGYSDADWKDGNEHIESTLH